MTGECRSPDRNSAAGPKSACWVSLATRHPCFRLTLLESHHGGQLQGTSLPSKGADRSRFWRIRGVWETKRDCTTHPLKCSPSSRRKRGAPQARARPLRRSPRGGHQVHQGGSEWGAGGVRTDIPGNRARCSGTHSRPGGSAAGTPAEGRLLRGAAPRSPPRPRETGPGAPGLGRLP